MRRLTTRAQSEVELAWSAVREAIMAGYRAAAAFDDDAHAEAEVALDAAKTRLTLEQPKISRR